MSTPRFEAIGPVSHTDAEVALATANSELIARTLIALGLHGDDWKWVQQQGLRFMTHESEIVVSAAILAIAHTVRVNGFIDKDAVIPALKALATNPLYRGKVQDALDDIEMYARQ